MVCYDTDMDRLTARTAIVTGAAQGIGAAIARRLADEGARVAVLDRSPAAADVAAQIGGIHATVDLTDDEDTRRVFADVLDELGGCWILVNNAGRFLKKPLLDTTLDEWDAVQRINVRACVATMQIVAPHMIRAGGGRIVNQASMAAKLGTPGEAAYAASKSALVALSRIAAMELGEHAITVNAICPGYVLTELGADTRDPAQVAAWTAKSPLGRLATPEDVAATVAHLASDDAAYVTGEALNVTGGMCTW
jgi:NAD(P)-dependent dehydrogenase (short-subunit alcohol dehydrogenase family)